MNVCRECLSGLMCSYFCMTYNGYKVEKVEEEVRIAYWTTLFMQTNPNCLEH
jgi:hypothetical protein